VLPAVLDVRTMQAKWRVLVGFQLAQPIKRGTLAFLGQLSILSA
jgi:hypothetical protein